MMTRSSSVRGSWAGSVRVRRVTVARRVRCTARHTNKAGRCGVPARVRPSAGTIGPSGEDPPPPSWHPGHGGPRSSSERVERATARALSERGPVVARRGRGRYCRCVAFQPPARGHDPASARRDGASHRCPTTACPSGEGVLAAPRRQVRDRVVRIVALSYLVAVARGGRRRGWTGATDRLDHLPAGRRWARSPWSSSRTSPPTASPAAVRGWIEGAVALVLVTVLTGVTGGVPARSCRLLPDRGCARPCRATTLAPLALALVVGAGCRRGRTSSSGPRGTRARVRHRRSSPSWGWPDAAPRGDRHGRRTRAPAGAGRGPAAGPLRPAHGPLQPDPLLRELERELRLSQRAGRGVRAADARPRRPQARQRHLRPSLRRPAADRRHRGHPRNGPGHRYARPVWRRRVRGAAAGDRRGRGVRGRARSSATTSRPSHPGRATGPSGPRCRSASWRTRTTAPPPMRSWPRPTPRCTRPSGAASDRIVGYTTRMERVATRMGAVGADGAPAPMPRDGDPDPAPAGPPIHRATVRRPLGRRRGRPARTPTGRRAAAPASPCPSSQTTRRAAAGRVRPGGVESPRVQ